MIKASSERKLQVSLETRFITLLLESEEQACLNLTLGIESFLLKQILTVP